MCVLPIAHAHLFVYTCTTAQIVLSLVENKCCLVYLILDQNYIFLTYKAKEMGFHQFFDVLYLKLSCYLQDL